MTVQKLVAKDYNGSMSRPVCEITGCLEENLHDIVLTKDGGVYLLCSKHMREYMKLSGQKWHREWEKNQELEFYGLEGLF